MREVSVRSHVFWRFVLRGSLRIVELGDITCNLAAGFTVIDEDS